MRGEGASATGLILILKYQAPAGRCDVARFILSITAMTKHNGNQSGSGKGNENIADRVNQIKSHLSPPASKNEPKQDPRKTTPLPSDHSDVLGQIAELRAIARTPDHTHRGYFRQKQAGKLWVRERIENLLDADSFQEIGSVAGTVTWQTTAPTREKAVSFVPSNNVQGAGLLGGRKILLTADDFTIRSGHADGSTSGKTLYLEKLALTLRIPVIKLVDGSSGGGSVTLIRKEGWSYLPELALFKYVSQQLDMGIPNLGAILGPAVSVHMPCHAMSFLLILSSSLRGATRYLIEKPCRLDWALRGSCPATSP